MILQGYINVKSGVLLVNLGTPDACSKPAVRRYLKEFLLDARVVSLGPLLRRLLVYGLILPFRPKETLKAYQSIWTENGSPLLTHSLEARDKLQQALGESMQVELAMRYGSPSIRQGLEALSGCDEITILPLFPQYASATTGSIIEEIFQAMKHEKRFPSLHVIRDFHQHKSFVSAQSQLIKTHLNDDDFLLLSYHGLPVNQLTAIGCECAALKQAKCQMKPPVSACYRQACLQTSNSIIEHLSLDSTQVQSAFQSRLGRTPWIEPYTDKVLMNLYAKGVRNLAVACPSFVVDCLETLEEIGMRLKEDWLTLGGERFTLIPCLNSHEFWINSLKQIVTEKSACNTT